MNTAPQTHISNYQRQEHGNFNGDITSTQQTQRSQVLPPYPPVDMSFHTQENIRPVVSGTSTARTSPARPVFVEERRRSHANAIASNFQIPRDVNDSGGSLAELAAQITCLFWFESSDVLQKVADSPVAIHPTKPLSADAKPTTGFRKWVTTILSTTCVAQNVVLLALLFIYRLKKQNPTVRGKPGSEYRLLTVALMLGNKFLDDNTYTNKTWAEVSGINVGEVHIMEVEFLSNMKYCLFTSEQDWTSWLALLGKFAAFFDEAARPQQANLPVPILPPASSLHVPMALPSPPVSNHASPPYNPDPAPHPVAQSMVGQHGPTPAPSPLGPFGEVIHAPSQQASRKRSRDESTTDLPAKRMMHGYQNYTSPHRYSTMAPQQYPGQPVPRLTLPSLSIPPPQSSNSGPPHLSQSHQLPPLNVPARAMAMVYPPTNAQAQSSQTPTSYASSSHQQPPPPHSQNTSRHTSPYADTNGTSPSGTLPHSASSLQAPTQISPSYFLQQRNSPYRPVHNVSTLLYPPPSGSIQSRPMNIELNQMHYQPLGKPTQHTGRLPYVGQNLWLDGNHPQEMTPIHRWLPSAHQQHVISPQ
ncbi:unnamed protein product [Zymoseptoria tritici ST99CH_3D7]|uniref:Cyclin N-terminal domain-containing protein n=1 Tax=Zymoseptoria tritici (strain ST99CH_3D7) TaxID=1276538 RepID=A0A1X7RJ61_ZYMT9|nr:unnamed protein product [Zymoseptoria tritici ST99CH_3D7]